MALNLGLGGSNTKQNSEVNTTQNQNQVESGSVQGQNITTTLDPRTIATLQGIIQTLAPNVGQSADASMIRQLSGQLANNLDPSLVNANIKAAQDVAIRNFNLNQGTQISNLQQLVGSKGNGVSQQVASQGNADISALLAQIDAQTRLQASGQRSADLSGAISGFAGATQVGQAPLNQLLASIATLTGARTEQNTNQTSLSNLIAALTSNQKSTGSSKSFGFSGGLTGE